MRFFVPKIILGVAITLSLGLASLPLEVSHAVTSCKKVQIIFARGSGEALNSSNNFKTFSTALTTALKATAPKVNFEISDLDYQAIAVDDLAVGAGALLSAGKAYAFGNSVKNGVQNLIAQVQSISLNCPSTKFVLAGYSQGALVVDNALSSLSADKIIYAATFGDPKLYLPEGKGIIPAACQGKNLSNYRINVPDCHVDEGILGGLNPYQTTSYLNRLGTWCNDADIMCGSSWDFSNLLGGHTSYTSLGRYTEAANLIAEKVKDAFHSTTLSVSVPSLGSPSNNSATSETDSTSQNSSQSSSNSQGDSSPQGDSTSQTSSGSQSSSLTEDLNPVSNKKYVMIFLDEATYDNTIEPSNLWEAVAANLDTSDPNALFSYSCFSYDSGTSATSTVTEANTLLDSPLFRKQSVGSFYRSVGLSLNSTMRSVFTEPGLLRSNFYNLILIANPDHSVTVTDQATISATYQLDSATSSSVHQSKFASKIKSLKTALSTPSSSLTTSLATTSPTATSPTTTSPTATSPTTTSSATSPLATSSDTLIFTTDLDQASRNLTLNITVPEKTAALAIILNDALLGIVQNTSSETSNLIITDLNEDIENTIMVKSINEDGYVSATSSHTIPPKTISLTGILAPDCGAPKI